MVAPNSNFITDQVVTLTSLDTKMTKCFPQLVSKQYRHKYRTCRLCKGTVAGKVGFHYKQIRASDISREKKAKFRGIFRGKFAEKSADFAGFSREKSQNLRKNWPISQEKSQNSQKNRLISRCFSGKQSNFEGFSGANS